MGKQPALEFRRDLNTNERRGSGRTTAILLRAMADASAAPNTWITIVDHWFGTTEANCRHQLDTVLTMANSFGLLYEGRMEQGRPQIRFNLVEVEWTDEERARFGFPKK